MSSGVETGQWSAGVSSELRLVRGVQGCRVS